jgi:hypothetical protein
MARASQWVGAAVVTTVVASSGVIVAGSSAADPVREEAAATSLVDRAHQAAGSLLERGTPLSPDERATLKTSPGVAEYKGNLDLARSLTPPPGAAAKASWAIIPAGDGSGGACIDVGDGLACGGPDLVASSGVAVTRITRPDRDARITSPWAPGGRVQLSGFVPENVTSVVVLDHNQKLVGRADVAEQLYTLDFATEDFGSIELRDSSGRAVKTVPYRG